MDIKSLKDKILQLAIQGKLVTQNENDEPASMLLERIKEEKEQLIKEKMIKKDKVLPEITDEEKLFDLPKGWEWTKIQKIAFVTKLAGFEYTKNIAPNLDDRGTVKLIKGKNIKNGNLILDCEDKITLDISLQLQRSALTKKCLLTPFVGTLGNVAIFDEDERYHLGANVAKIELFNNKTVKILEEYVKYYLLSLFGKKELMKHSKSTAQESISMEAIRDTIIAIPPLEEQKRIVAKIDELFKLIDELENNKQDFLENIAYTRNKVLQLAIQGKLVDQCEDDEPTSILLEKIKVQKEQLIKDKVIKKEKPLPEISEEEKQFELPKGWEWCRLGEISNYIKAGGDKPKDFSNVKSREYGIPVIANGKTNTGIVGYTKIATENNICITVSGRGTIGYSCIRKEPFCPIVRLIVICPSIGIDISYLNYALHYFVEQGVGTSIQQLTVPMIKPKIIPLPPLEEQKRIVKKVDLIMDYLDKLQQEIESQEVILDHIV